MFSSSIDKLSQNQQTKKNVLFELFGNSIPHNIIDNCAKITTWDLETCIDYLIKYVEDESENNNQASYTISNRTAHKLDNFSSDKALIFPSKQRAILKTSPDFPTISKSCSSKTQGNIDQILSNIQIGYKVMIIMRGTPGSGKTYLAHDIVEKVFANRKYGDYVFSSDDFFYDERGVYKYDRTKISEAHEFNEKRVKKKATMGWSPIIVDNTNICIWEFLTYVKIAVQNGYLIELLQPFNRWGSSVGQLALRNKHGVPKDKIQRMLDKFEPATVNDVVKMLKNTKYTTPLPQMRNHPPILNSINPQTKSNLNKVVDSSKANTPKVDVDVNEDILTKIDCGIHEFSSTSMHNIDIAHQPKEQINTSKSINNKNNSIPIGTNQQENSISHQHASWKPYEVESKEFWASNIEYYKATRDQKTKPTENVLITLLKESMSDGKLNALNKESIINESLTENHEKIERHTLGCPNESKSFILLRQIYPNKDSNGLWDLFEKCNGDVDWAINILLKGDSGIVQSLQNECLQNFNCKCDESVTLPDINLNVTTEPKNPKHKSEEIKLKFLDVKKEIEKQFVLSDQYYSSYLKKIRDKRTSYTSEILQKNMQKELEFLDINGTNVIETNQYDCEQEIQENSNGDGTNFVEVDLGTSLIEQLSNHFAAEFFVPNAPQYKTNIFLPISLAKQLYAIWMESVYTQIEEQRQKTLKEDEEFARILQNPKYSSRKVVPNNFSEILDMELAWKIYNTERDALNWNIPQQDLASHLSRMKLSELFPDVDEEILTQVYSAHNNNFSDTLYVLKNSMNYDVDFKIDLAKNQLIKIAKNENDMILEQKQKEQYLRNNIRSISEENKDEAKRIALLDFEESRNLAVHHSQLKAECFQKAKEAVQKGNSSVAVYYSQIANLHKNKIDLYNHTAANCIMEVHDLTQKNPDFIDLHYLHVMEALQCLDIFIDKHIWKMKSISKSYKHIFIITGRGLHSAGGVSTIKNKVKSRLKDRNLKWSEVNPGLLKVKLFSASKYSKNL